MERKQLLTTLLLGALAEITLLGVFVLIAEPPHRVGRPVRLFHVWELAYLTLPLLLVAAASFTPARMLLRRRYSPAGKA